MWCSEVYWNQPYLGKIHTLRIWFFYSGLKSLVRRWDDMSLCFLYTFGMICHILASLFWLFGSAFSQIVNVQLYNSPNRCYRFSWVTRMLFCGLIPNLTIESLVGGSGHGKAMEEDQSTGTSKNGPLPNFYNTNYACIRYHECSHHSGCEDEMLPPMFLVRPHFESNSVPWILHERLRHRHKSPGGPSAFGLAWGGQW